MVGIRSLERITSDLWCALPKKVRPAPYHLVSLRTIRYYICSQGGGVKLCVYTLHTGGAKTTCRMYMYLNCPVWHTTGLFFIWTEAEKAFCDNAMTDSQLTEKYQYHYNHKFYFIYYIHIPLIVPKTKTKFLEVQLEQQKLFYRQW